MKKKIVVGVLSAAMLLGGAAVAWGAEAVDSTKLAEIKALTQEMFSIHQQIVDKEVEAGLLTQEQGDKMKEFMEERQQRSEEALDNGQVEGFGMGMGPRLGMMDRENIKFNEGEPLTEEQIATWVENAQTRLNAQEEAMRSEGKLTEEQIKTWVDAAAAQLEVQEEALRQGTFLPGGMGMHGGKIMIKGEKMIDGEKMLNAEKGLRFSIGL
ncbi:Protein of unknown function (DUF2680) [Desulfitobacterium dichloroeliminans LMG P-21439]|uniref:DUF2680 domain-containing protein n=1 Tax=Desulfitobacterium dichloroeliminans (strain LMG P-21439 / DCA1) TaxID=871963 RepID=L0F4E7_DESDL|nr:DUF2680 domain-containing protein [Desulfitobacterium dichloroeliminans]AGA67925.1 Protein of unknown function (DUF2680) [Desulfitobacterium dichloroeliminans LMG P-21439]